MTYETWHTPSWDIEKVRDHYPGKTYICENCGVELYNHEVFLRSNGKPYCGCCK